MNDSDVKEYLVFFKQNIVDLRNQSIYANIDMYFNRDTFLKNISNLENNGLIIEDDERNLIYSITEKGEKYLRQITKELEYNSEKERIKFETSKIDLRLKKWQVKTFWWIFGFAFIGFGFSAYNFINNLSYSKNIEWQEIKIEQMELELGKLKTSILNQKTKDSLSNSKDLKNIENIEKSINK